MADRCLYFGCWNDSGHHLFGPGGCRTGADVYPLYKLSDGLLAPKRRRADGAICWAGQGANNEEQCAIYYNYGQKYDELPQGQFLRHDNVKGFTAISWWDRCQGDKRGGCNSTIFLEGVHTSEELLTALAEHFPHVLENLNRAAIKLVEVNTETIAEYDAAHPERQ